MKRNLIAVLFAVLVIVGLTCCGGPGSNAMPDVTGRSVAQAIEMLDDAGYYDQTLRYSDGDRAYGGMVCGQSPQAGTEQSTDVRVVLTVTGGMACRQRVGGML